MSACSRDLFKLQMQSVHNTVMTNAARVLICQNTADNGRCTDGGTESHTLVQHNDWLQAMTATHHGAGIHRRCEHNDPGTVISLVRGVGCAFKRIYLLR